MGNKADNKNIVDVDSVRAGESTLKGSEKGIQNIAALIKNIWRHFFTREIITYLIAGVLTSFINLAVTYAAYELLGIEELISNTIAWIAAVAFAYIINSYWVFKSSFISAEDEINKAVKFVSGRIASFIVEQAGVLVFVKLLDFKFMIVKVVLAVIVTIINYIISKMFVFVKKKE